VITEIIRYKINAENANSFIADYQKSLPILMESGFCETIEILQQDENPELFQIIIRWKSKEAHMEGFRKSQAFQDFFLLVKPYFNNILEMQHYRSVI
jgi:hemoglobin